VTTSPGAMVFELTTALEFAVFAFGGKTKALAAVIATATRQAPVLRYGIRAL